MPHGKTRGLAIDKFEQAISECGRAQAFPSIILKQPTPVLNLRRRGNDRLVAVLDETVASKEEIERILVVRAEYPISAQPKKIVRCGNHLLAFLGVEAKGETTPICPPCLNCPTVVTTQLV